jgi:hypothetical protein
MTKIVKKVADDTEKSIRYNLRSKLLEEIEEIKKRIIDKYDEELTSAVTDRNSKTNPILYRNEFVDKLNEFVFIEDNSGTLHLNVPNMENFVFAGRLKVLETILNGVAGVYKEVSEKDYVEAFGKKPVNEDPIDEYVPVDDRIYLVRNTPILRRAEDRLRKEFTKYPFSNKPPIDIFDEVGEYVDSNIGSWIEDSIEKAQKGVVSKYKGATV